MRDAREYLRFTLDGFSTISLAGPANGAWSYTPTAPNRGPAFTGDITIGNATIIDKSVDEQPRSIV